MLVKNIILVLAVALVLGFSLGFAVEPAYAQGAAADRSLAAKESGSLGNKEWDKDKLPGKQEVGMALGSIALLFAAFKWL